MKINLIVLVFLISVGKLLSQCNASFTWDDTDITIQFFDLSSSDPSDPIVNWFWDFDDPGSGNTYNVGPGSRQSMPCDGGAVHAAHDDGGWQKDRFLFNSSEVSCGGTVSASSYF